MPPFLQFLIRRFLVVPVSLLVITMVLYGGVMLTPPEVRAQLYIPERLPNWFTEADLQRLTEKYVERYHLNDPFLVQYTLWLKALAEGTWGYSPTLSEEVLPALLRRFPATIELTLYSLLLFVPIGLATGTIAGWKQHGGFDRGFRMTAFLATSIPPFILAVIFLSVFYIGLGWFSPERISTSLSFVVTSSDWHSYTGLLTIDSLLNKRPDVALDALRHLFMPVVTLSLYHWATLARITRATVVNESRKEYIVSARARGLADSRVIWRHAFRNVLAPSLTSIALSAASLLGGVYVVEIIYSFRGISRVITGALTGAPDAQAAMGFAVFSVFSVVLLMFLLDVLQAVLDPRVREEYLRA